MDAWLLGSGLAMATMDIIKLYGKEQIFRCRRSSKEKVEAFKLILSIKRKRNFD